MVNVWMTSDTHFDHDNIRLYENRPFKDVNEMNDTMIANWNKLVRKDDIVMHMGDFGLGSKEHLKEICSQLKGYKILIRGNHDRSRKSMLEIGFDEVYNYPIIYKGFFMLSHEPLYVNCTMPYVNIHGHIHGNKMASEHYFNACVEHSNYGLFKYSDIHKFYVKEEEE